MNKRSMIFYIAVAGLISNVNASELEMSKHYSDCQEWPDTSSMYEGCMLNHETEDMQKEIEGRQKQILKFSARPATRKALQKSVGA